MIEKKKIILMIPARLGSKRVPKKNIRLLAGKPLIVHAIEKAKACGDLFDEIWINGDDQVFAAIAAEHGVNYYNRPKDFATDNSTNDDFMWDFLKRHECDSVIQLLCTSPFVTVDDITRFTYTYIHGGFDSLVSVKNVQIECMNGTSPINFLKLAKTKPSQALNPVKAYGCCLMGWNSKQFISSYETNSGAYHGGVGNTGYFVIGGNATIDIDTEDDFVLAEAMSIAMKSKRRPPRYYSDAGHAESGSEGILKKDGVKHVNNAEFNKMLASIPKIISKNPTNESWSHRLVASENVSATLIAQLKDESNRRHYHPDIAEFWLIVQGEYKFEMGNDVTVVAATGDVVFADEEQIHKIVASGENGLNIRLAVSRTGAEHVYVKEEINTDHEQQ